MTERCHIPLSVTMLRRVLAPPLILAGVLSIVFACSDDQNAIDIAKVEDPVERGRQIYISHCSACHRADGEGQPDWQKTNPDGTLPAPPLNGDGHTWHHGDGTLFKQVSLGGAYLEEQGLPGFKSGMPAFGELLTPQEIIDVLTYVKSLWGDKNVHGVTKKEAQATASENDPFPSLTSE